MNADTFIAANRFGLGPRPDDIPRIAANPRSWLLGQLERPLLPPEAAYLQKGGNDPAAAAFYEDIASLLQNKANKSDAKKLPGRAKAVRDLYIRQVGERFLAQMNSDQPLIERLVMFWSNHFTVSIQKPIITPLVFQFEAQAIRPYVTGRFADMLKAAERHPAMLMYLDNVRSIGPNSRAGQKRGKGLNENLAREILELHTLGVGGGYTQRDVIAFAKIITGWSLDRKGGEVPGYAFQPLLHEPGPKTLLGKVYAEAGEREGLQALDDLAAHPSTARHIATKLARHFIADDPPPAAVSQLAQSFSSSGGNLLAVYKTLIGLSEAWQDPLAKFKTPYEYILSASRLLGAKPKTERVIVACESVNYKVFAAPSPAGYEDAASAWVSPDAILKRIEWAKTVSQIIPSATPPLQLAAAAFGPVMREETRMAIQGAPSAADGYALLLSSPEFQRR